jgi:uncharacterized protein (DUF1684 family)
VSGSISLLDWRRQVSVLYAEVRAEPDVGLAHAGWARRRERLVRTHPDSPVPADRRAAFTGLDIAPYDPAFRYEVGVDTDVVSCRLEVITGTDGVVLLDRIGVLHLPIGDLDVWWVAGYGGGVFVPVKDGLAGTRTYGGGRYVLDTLKGADLGGDGDTLVVDLNFAYNPSCAYDPAWACPLAPPGNEVAAALPVGELWSPLTDATAPRP